MRYETAMGEKLRQAAPDMVEASDLYSIAMDLLRGTNGNPGRATAAFVSKVFAFNLIYPLARAYLEECAADMKGGDAGQNHGDTQHAPASAPPHQRDGSGRSSTVTQERSAAPSHPIAGGRGHTIGETHYGSVPPVREPTPLQKTASFAAFVDSAKTVLDTFTVRDGRAIGNIYWRELAALQAENAIEAAVISGVRRSVANASPDARVRDVVKAKDLEDMIAKAKADMRVAA